MLEWLSNLQQLVIPDGAVEGLSSADKPFVEGALLQLPAEDSLHFFCGQQIHVFKKLRMLLPDMLTGQPLHTATRRPHSSAYSCALHVLPRHLSWQSFHHNKE